MLDPWRRTLSHSIFGFDIVEQKSTMMFTSCTGPLLTFSLWHDLSLDSYYRSDLCTIYPHGEGHNAHESIRLYKETFYKYALKLNILLLMFAHRHIMSAKSPSVSYYIMLRPRMRSRKSKSCMKRITLGNIIIAIFALCAPVHLNRHLKSPSLWCLYFQGLI